MEDDVIAGEAAAEDDAAGEVEDQGAASSLLHPHITSVGSSCCPVQPGSQ